MAALFLAASTMVFVSCSKDDDDKIQCWELIAKYQGRSESMFFWGTGVQADAIIKETKDDVGPGYTFSKKVSKKKQADCINDWDDEDDD
jgi:hypothetical protein